jgi:phytoene synthase
MDVVANAREVLATRARSFRWGSAFLGADRRDDAAVVYAMCRLVDDIADDPAATADAASDLEQVRQEVQRASLPRPLVAVFHAVSTRRGIDPAWMLELIEGCRDDLFHRPLPDDTALLRYSYRVAGTVGLMMCGVLGVKRPEARAFAIDLGVAMQLTNICRDVAEDAGMGRVYLPAERLRHHGTSPEALLRGTADRGAVAKAVGELLELAEAYYRSAWLGLRYIPWPGRLAILVAAKLYRAIGRRLAAHGGDALAGRTVVPWTAKLRLTLASVFDLFSPTILGWNAPPEHDSSLHRPLAGLPAVDLPSKVSDELPDQDRLGDDWDPEGHADRVGATARSG